MPRDNEKIRRHNGFVELIDRDEKRRIKVPPGRILFRRGLQDLLGASVRIGGGAMRILFLRHADAEVIRTTDEARALTAKGNRQARRVGGFLSAAGLRPRRILTSPLVRAQETAGLVAGVAGLPEPEVVNWLACGMTAGRCFSECEKLASDQEGEELLLVGHEPDFSETIGEWIGGESSVAMVRVRKASLTGLDVSAFVAGGAGLEFLVPVRLITHAS